MIEVHACSCFNFAVFVVLIIAPLVVVVVIVAVVVIVVVDDFIVFAAAVVAVVVVVLYVNVAPIVVLVVFTDTLCSPMAHPSLLLKEKRGSVKNSFVRAEEKKS